MLEIFFFTNCSINYDCASSVLRDFNKRVGLQLNGAHCSREQKASLFMLIIDFLKEQLQN